MRNGYPLPDPGRTPGAINPTVVVVILRNFDFRTNCVRNKVASETQKATTYQTYDMPHPARNTGTMEVREDVPIPDRDVKEKDIVEEYLAKRVRDGLMALAGAQRGVAVEWTQYIDVALTARRSDESHQ